MDVDGIGEVQITDAKVPLSFKTKIVWRNVIILALLHIGALYGLYLLIFYAKWPTVGWTIFLYIFSGLGITAGAHRHWSHKSYKAKQPLEVLLLIMNCMALQNDVIEWSRDHRCHHKFSETNADPHDSRRGLFFSHVGWLMCKKHPDVLSRGKTVDMSDLENDPILQFQRRHYLTLSLSLCFLLPTVIPLLWGESIWVGYLTSAVFRYIFTNNVTWTVNSLAHMYGTKPYDKRIGPTQSLASTVGTIGEGWHNYHHSFPMDYRASEYGWRINLTSIVIDTFAAIGWAYDLKTVSQQVVDQTRLKYGEQYEGHWGYVYG